MRKVILLIIFIILIIPVNVFAVSIKEYNIVGIGDSIMYGYTVDSTENFFNLVSNEIQKNLNPQIQFNAKNLGINGLDSTGLLDLLKSDKDFIKYIKSANLIEISIGGNDALLPLTRFAIKEMNITTQPGELDVFSKLQQHPKELLSLDYNKLEPIMIQSRDNFITNTWPSIIKRINELNPSAKIIVINTFNPYRSLKSIINVIEPSLVDTIDIVDDGVNQEISSYAQGRYEIIDAAKPFDSIAGLILTNLSKTDPHPNVAGHEVIYALHRNVLEKYHLINKVYLNEPKIDVPFIGNITLRDTFPILENLKKIILTFDTKNISLLAKGVDYHDVFRTLIKDVVSWTQIKNAI